MTPPVEERPGEPPAFLSEADPEASWQMFLRDHSERVYRSVGRICGDEDEARDVAARVLEHLREDWPATMVRFRSGDGPARSRFSTWLAVVVRNLAIDQLRARYGRRTTPRIVQRLPEWQQELYRLRYREGMALGAIWESLRASGAFAGDWEELREAARALHEALPRGARVASVRTWSLDAGAGPGTEPDDEPSLGAAVPAPVPSPAEGTLRISAEHILREILGELAGDERLLVRTYFLEGASAADLVGPLGAQNRNQVYRRAHEVLEHLRQRLAERGLTADDVERLAEFDWAGALGPVSGDAP